MIRLDGSSLTLDQIDAIAGGAPFELALEVPTRVRAARAVVEAHVASGQPVYGINTGFGALADVTIPADQLAALQLNLLRSHAAGVGEPLRVPAVRALIALRANVLAKGFSGVRLETLEALVALANAGVHPWVPTRGSVGASGDLAPLAHLALVLVGEGKALADTGRHDAASTPGVMSGADALTRAGLTPITLAPKEGLALINGTQASAAVLALAVVAAERLAHAADIAAAMSIDALRGSMHPFEARIHAARPVPGQTASAANLTRLMDGSPVNRSHEHCGKVQDAYALRCAPQVHGAAREAIGFARRLAEIEANAATDNPMVFADTGEILSGGNFHGAPIALAADTLALGVAQLTTISERRTDRLMTPSASGLPAFLVRESGLNSGLMMAHVTAAALTAEVKVLCHPASVDTIPTSAGREDHVSMSMGAALKGARVVDLATQVLAIEILASCQAFDLLAPLATSPPLERVRRMVRTAVPTLVTDRPPAPDIEAIARFITTGAIERACDLELR
jgi:histidine ammonia-lyase